MSTATTTTDYAQGDIAWILTSTAFVLLMIPGAGLFYAGLARRKSALSLLFLPIAAACIVFFQWFFWGYSLTFSHTGSSFIGDLSNIGFRNVLAEPSVASSNVPDLLFSVYQGMFAAITAALAVGAVAERGRAGPCLLFVFIWTTLVYDPIAYWTWNPAGWAAKLGGLDFAGGTPVHIASGSAALAYSFMLGKRRGHGTFELNFRPHNTTYVIIGTLFLWVGWFGFNAGSALSANLRAAMAAVVTNLAAGVGGIAWCAVDYRLEQRFSAVGLCSGIVAGLVAITPGSGYVPPWAALIYGVVAGVGCNFATKLKLLIRVDDALDVFAIHGVGGFLGDLLTGIFASNYIAALDGTTDIQGGWVDGHWVQLAIQLADGATGMSYSFVLSCLILFAISYIPGMHLRASNADEIMGMDECEVGEFAYDYVEVERDVANSAEDSAALRRGQLSESQVDMSYDTDDISLRAYAGRPGMKE
ncbi:ammonium transporter Amt1 [Knufia obscura]|uniref:Ammonium transporter n=2 Tax=Knufia TaxID=430999 RepID=A0AAN8FHI5_9EURO|nr:ammonium transporter Amt1 [Knufia obscura]KAK5958796.1 ammonium transporter Amt1 [Knufia fluminis]